MNKYLFAPLLVQAQQILAKDQDHCYALVLGGGGSASAYETGYLWGLVNYDDPKKYQYDMVTGLSGGSINALGVAGFPKGTEKEMVEWLTDHWRSLHTKDVFHLWDKWDPIIHGIFKESGVFDDHPLSVLMNEILKDIGDKYGNSFKRMITIEAMDAISGSLIPFTEKTIDYLDFAKVVLSSASLPGVFPATKWGDWLFIDGGLVWGANVVSAVKRCREIVDSDDKISVDMLITHAGSMNTLEKSSSDAIANVMRLRQIKNFENGFAQVLKFMVDFPEVNFRHFAIPSKNIGPGPTRLDFEDSFTWPMQELGREDCKRDLQKPEGHVFAHLRMFQGDPKDLNQYMADYLSKN